MNLSFKELTADFYKTLQQNLYLSCFFVCFFHLTNNYCYGDPILETLLVTLQILTLSFPSLNININLLDNAPGSFMPTVSFGHVMAFKDVIRLQAVSPTRNTWPSSYRVAFFPPFHHFLLNSTWSSGTMQTSGHSLHLPQLPCV